MRVIPLTVLIALAGTASASALTLDFEGLRSGQGTITGTEVPGVTISLSGSNAGALGVYDSSCRANCTGGDSDLATGSSITSAPINASEDTPAEDFILINSAGSGSNFGDIDGTSTFTFTYDIPQFVDRFVLIDIDENASEVGFTFNFADGATPFSFDGTSVTNTPVPNGGEDNAYSIFDIAQISTDLGDPSLLRPVSSLEIAFDGISGGIASVETTPVPVPAALPLMGAGLLALGAVRRRRKG